MMPTDDALPSDLQAVTPPPAHTRYESMTRALCWQIAANRSSVVEGVRRLRILYGHNHATTADLPELLHVLDMALCVETQLSWAEQEAITHCFDHLWPTGGSWVTPSAMSPMPGIMLRAALRLRENRAGASLSMYALERLIEAGLTIGSTEMPEATWLWKQRPLRAMRLMRRVMLANSPGRLLVTLAHWPSLPAACLASVNRDFVQADGVQLFGTTDYMTFFRRILDRPDHTACAIPLIAHGVPDGARTHDVFHPGHPSAALLRACARASSDPDTVAWATRPPDAGSSPTVVGVSFPA